MFFQFEKFDSLISITQIHKSEFSEIGTKLQFGTFCKKNGVILIMNRDL